MELVYSFDVYMLISTLIAVSLQIYLFVVVIVVSPPAMSQYRYFLCLFIFWDCFYNLTVGILVMPEMCLPAPAALVNGFGQNLVKWFGFNVNGVLFGMIFWGGADIIQLQLYCLMYRFCAINPDPKYMRWLMSWTVFIGLHVTGYVITFSVAIPGFMATANEARAHELMNTFPKGTFPEFTELTTIIFMDVESPYLTVLAIYAVSLCVLSIVVGFSISIYIIQYLHKNASSFTATTYKMHIQLTMILIIQQITPIVFVMLPVAAAGYMITTNQIERVSPTAFNIGIAMLTIYPSTNCLICIYFCSPYYNFTKKWIHYVLYRMHMVKKERKTTTVIVPTSVALI